MLPFIPTIIAMIVSRFFRKFNFHRLATAGNMLAMRGINKILTYRKRATNGSYLITLFVYANDTPIF